MIVLRVLALGGALLSICSGTTSAQTLVRAGIAAPAPAAPGSDAATLLRQAALFADTAPPSAWRALRVAKWTTAAGAGAATAFGFINNRRADEAFQDLERWCQDNTTACTDRLPSGAYRDPGAEAEYQRIRSLDRRARSGLIAAQLGVAASVALFILDLRNEQPPPNIPFDPRRLQIGAARDGGFSAGWAVPLPLPFR